MVKCRFAVVQYNGDYRMTEFWNGAGCFCAHFSFAISDAVAFLVVRILIVQVGDCKT